MMENLFEGLIDYLASKSPRFLFVVGVCFLLVSAGVWFWYVNIPSFSGQNLLGVFVIAGGIGLFFFVCGIICILMSISKSIGQQREQESADMDDQAEHFDCYDPLERDTDSIKVETKVSFRDPFLEFLEKRKSNRN